MSQSQQSGIPSAVQANSSLSTTEVALSVDSTTTLAVESQQESGSDVVALPIGWSESSIILEKFELFPTLPIELRLKIWKGAIGGPRTIEITFERDAYYQKGKKPDTGKKGSVAGVRYKHRCISKSGRLGTLWANSEAREETLKWNPVYLQMYQGQKIYFNPAVDTVFIDLHSLFVLYELFDLTWYVAKSPRTITGFSRIQYLATPLTDNRINGLEALKRRVFKGLQAPISTINGLDRGPASSQMLHSVVSNLNQHMHGKNLTQKQQGIVDSLPADYNRWVGYFFIPNQ